MRFVTHSVDETEALGERLAKTLHGGEIIAFTGDREKRRSPADLRADSGSRCV